MSFEDLQSTAVLPGHWHAGPFNVTLSYNSLDLGTFDYLPSLLVEPRSSTKALNGCTHERPPQAFVACEQEIFTTFNLRIVCENNMKMRMAVKEQENAAARFPLSGDIGDVICLVQDLCANLAKLCDCKRISAEEASQKLRVPSLAVPGDYHTPPRSPRSPSINSTTSSIDFDSDEGDASLEPEVSDGRIRFEVFNFEYGSVKDEATPEFIRIDVNRAIISRIRSNLRQQSPSPNGRATDSRREGWIYIMRTPDDPQHFKIGLSEIHPKIRRQALEKCYPGITLVALSTKSFPHAHRGEKLIHTELGEQRRKHHCGKCGHRHSEWFEVSLELALQVMVRWIGWMHSCPYHLHTGKLKDAWGRKLRKPLAKLMLPAVDHVLFENTWEIWTDDRALTGRRSDEAPLITICDRTQQIQ